MLKSLVPPVAPTLGSAVCALTLVMNALPVSAAETPKAFRVFLGTYTGPKSQGIYISELDLGTGRLSTPQLAAETPNPTFLALHPNRQFLYAANEIGQFGGTNSGAVSAFAIDGRTGKLTLLSQAASVGSGPCHLTVDAAGKHVLAANYGGGSVVVLPLRDDFGVGPATSFIQHTGSSVNPRRQKEPHAHSVNLDPANRFAFVADLGLDQLLSYRFDPAEGRLSPNDPAFLTLPPGAGPRHFSFHPSGRQAFVINELDSTLTALDYDPTAGKLTARQTVSTLPAGYQGESTTAEVQVHPNGRFVYGSNRGHDSLAIFRWDAAAGRLELVGHQPSGGQTPRNFGIDPTGSYLLAANQNSDNVVCFRIDPQTGKLTPVGEGASLGSPVCVKFAPLPK